MPQEYAYLSKVFPNFKHTTPLTIASVDNGRIKLEPFDQPPDYIEPTIDPLQHIYLKPWQKLRIVYGSLEVDTRYDFMRKFTGDSRWKVLEFLDNITSHYKKYILEILSTTTYSKDKKWVNEANIQLKKCT